MTDQTLAEELRESIKSAIDQLNKQGGKVTESAAYDILGNIGATLGFLPRELAIKKGAITKKEMDQLGKVANWLWSLVVDFPIDDPDQEAWQAFEERKKILADPRMSFAMYGFREVPFEYKMETIKAAAIDTIDERIDWDSVNDYFEKMKAVYKESFNDDLDEEMLASGMAKFVKKEFKEGMRREELSLERRKAR